MLENQSARLPQPLAVAGRHARTADIQFAAKESTQLRSAVLEIYRVDQSAEVVRTFEVANARFDLLKFVKHSSPELEFLTSSHLVIFWNGGISKGCEWSDGDQTRIFKPSAPYAAIFNPAQNYLRLRAHQLKHHCYVLILKIRPCLMSWRGDLEIDLAAVQFQPKIGLNDGAVCQTLLAMQQELEAPGINGAFYVDILLFLLLIQLMRCASNLAGPSKTSYAKGGLPRWRLKRAIELLEGNLPKMPTVGDVAQQIGLHPTSFCRGFKQSTGLSPHRYILEHRLNRAKEMMNNQRLSLTEIALDCGFSCSSQFSVVFRRITGVSPRDYRRSL